MFKVVFFKNALGEVHEVTLPEVDAIASCWKFPWEWSFDGVFAEPPEGFVFSHGNGGGRGRVPGASVRAD
jgi:hypothetical protein